MTSRIRLCLLATALFAFGTTAFAAKPLSPNTSFETTFGTFPPLQGEVVDGSGDGPGWAGPWSSDHLSELVTYDNTQSTTGQWSMLLDTTLVGGEPQIGRVFAKPIKKGLLLLRVRVNRNDANHLGIFLSNGDPNLNNHLGTSDFSGRAIFVAIGPEKYYNATPGFGDIAAYDGTVETVIGDNVASADSWHEILIEFNCNNEGGTYNVYVNGDKINAAPLHFYAPQISLDRFHVYTGASQNQDGSSNQEPGSKHWIEDVVVWRK